MKTGPTVPAFPPNALAGALAPFTEPPAPNTLAGPR